ncbi:hypothetical protein LSM04_001009 [Trypanosoma melophagium]|uniref:uncharacterized protein n=1 Tax=Trypanosoma melophagium TaxID=715481 RepID=UPI00351A009B|nr:hypothetical protein LSM04_001009 [Trypanosoma melophagium]
MSFPASEKPSSRFRVLLRREPEQETGVMSTSQERVCDNISHGTMQNSTAMSRAVDFSVKDDTYRGMDGKPQRYGGAIVRVSELRRAGGLTYFSAVDNEGRCGADSNKERKLLASSYLHFLGTNTNLNNKELDSRALSTFALPRTGEKDFDGRDARRRLSTSSRKGPGKAKNKNNTRIKNSKSYTKPRGANVRHGRKKGNNLELQTNGELYSYRWSTKNGRRQLHYGSRTYTGRAAHQIWDKIKTVLKSKEASSLPSQSPPSIVIPPAPQPPRLVETGKKMNDFKRSRVEATIVANTAAKRSCRESYRTSQTTLLTERTGSLSSSVRPKLLLDDEDNTNNSNNKPLYQNIRDGDVVLVSDSEDSDSCSSVSSTLSSWPSLRAGSSEVTIDDGDLVSQDPLGETEKDFYRGYHDKKNNTIMRLNNQKGNFSPSKNSSDVFEHDGWLYPTELLPLLCKENSTCNSLPLGDAAVENLAASSNMNTKNAKMVYQNFEKGNNRDNEQGITVLGNKGTNTASSLLLSSVEMLPSIKDAAYSERYEEMNALLDLPIEDVGDLFVTGEEIGGMRFAS